MALEVKTLPVFLLAGLAVGLLLVGPRRAFAAPVWLTGWWQLWRAPRLRAWRAFAVAGVVLVVVFLVVDGKPYYLSGMFPVLLAAGAQPTLDWANGTGRRALFGFVLVGSAAVSAVLMLPVLPVGVLHDTPIVAINYDGGETVGWPAFVRTVAGAYDRLPAAQPRHAVVLTGNQGEDGAIARFRPDVPVYGVQYSDWDLGPPPTATSTVVTVGFGTRTLHRWFRTVHRVATIDNGVDVDNDEQGGAVRVCSGPTRTWASRWAGAQRLG